jgi:hypothetical protein
MLLHPALLHRDATTTVLVLFPFLRLTFSLLCVLGRLRKMANLLFVRRYLHSFTSKKRCEHRWNDVNTVVMFLVRTKKLPFRLLQVRWLEAAGFAGF